MTIKKYVFFLHPHLHTDTEQSERRNGGSLKMKKKKLSNQLQSYVTENLRERGIAYQLEECGAYSIITLNAPSALWAEIVQDAKYQLQAEKDQDDSCYLPVVSIRTFRNNKAMRRLQDVFATHCFFLKEEQAEIMQYLYA